MTARTGEPGDRSRNVDYVVPVESIDPVALPPIEVSDVVVGEQSVSFDVDEVGVPVLVRVSYFPNWNVSGADGPYRVSPNFIVVVPTSNEVRLTYDRSTLDWFFYALTGLGIALCVFWRRRGDMEMIAVSGGSALPPPTSSGGLIDDHAVTVVPDVWAAARPETDGSDPTPLHLAAPIGESDIVIDTSPPPRPPATGQNVAPGDNGVGEQEERRDERPENR